MSGTPTERQRWTVATEDYTGQLYLHDDARFDDRFVAKGLDAEEAEYAAMLLNAGYFDDDDLDLATLEDLILEAVARQQCSRCDAMIFAPQADTAGRCADCQS